MANAGLGIIQTSQGHERRGNGRITNERRNYKGYWEIFLKDWKRGKKKASIMAAEKIYTDEAETSTKRQQENGKREKGREWSRF